MTVHYLVPPDPGPVELAVAVERTGRSLVSLSSRMLQGDRLVALALAAFSPPCAGVELVEATMPSAPSYDHTAAEVFQGGRPFRAPFEQRPVIPPPPRSGADSPRS